MKDSSIGGHRYRLVAVEREGTWVAHAERADTGDHFGVHCAGSNEGDAMKRLARWLEWQSEHAAALDALQQAERTLHRAIAGSAFANPAGGPTPIEMQEESREQVEAARVRLDEIRARKPE